MIQNNYLLTVIAASKFNKSGDKYDNNLSQSK